MSDIGNFFNSLPFFTRYWFALSIAVPLFSRFGILNPAYLILEYSAFIHKFQIWRPITALFFFPLGPNTAFSYLLNLYFLYNYSVRLETGLFAGRPADYCFLLLFNWIALVMLPAGHTLVHFNKQSMELKKPAKKGIALAFSIWMLMEPMILSVLYIWCQVNKETIVSFWFGTQFRAVYLPWVLFGFNFILRGGGFEELIGIIVGHLYYFLMYSYPLEHNGPTLLRTPQILYEYFPSRSNASGGFGVPPAARQPPRSTPRDQRGHSWGSGRTLND